MHCRGAVLASSVPSLCVFTRQPDTGGLSFEQDLEVTHRGQLRALVTQVAPTGASILGT